MQDQADEKVFAKGLDVMQAIIAGELDVGTTAPEAAISGRASGAPIYVVAGFPKGGARLVAHPAGVGKVFKAGQRELVALKARRAHPAQLHDELLRSIEEALYLADRIVVMTYRPGTVKRDLLVDLERARDAAAPEFNVLKRELGALVMEEQQRHHTDELRMAALD